MNSFGTRLLMGNTLLRRGILILVLRITSRGLSGGGRRYGNYIVPQKIIYSSGVY